MVEALSSSFLPPPFVTVIVPIQNERDHIPTCFTPLLSQSYPAARYEIFVVDSGSTDGSIYLIRQMSEEKPSVRFAVNPHLMTAAAYNTGIGFAKGDIIALISSHALITKNYLETCVKHLTITRAGNVGGSAIAVGKTFMGKAIALAHSSLFGLGGAKFRSLSTQLREVDTVFQGVFPKKIFQECGLFDEELVRNWDIEFNHRLRKAGKKIILIPDLNVEYYCRDTLSGLWKQNYLNGLWNIRTVQKSPGSLKLRHFVPLLFVSSLFILGGLSIFSNLARYSLVFVLSAYVSASLFSSLLLCAQNGWEYFLVLPIVFATLHLSYGFGSIVGLFKFGVPWKHSARRQ